MAMRDAAPERMRDGPGQSGRGRTSPPDRRRWQAGPEESEIRFSLRHLVFPVISGRVGRWRASFDVDFDEPSRSTVEVVVDAGSLETGAVERDNHVRSIAFLDVRSFPEIRFRSKEVRPGDGEGHLVIVGDLTVRDVTREVTVLAERQRVPGFPDGGAPLVFTATATVNRRAFGLRWHQDLDHGGVIAGDNIELQMSVEARPAARET
jgi:polyisoprenoid-binding protein YceI